MGPNEQAIANVEAVAAEHTGDVRFITTDIFCDAFLASLNSKTMGELNDAWIETCEAGHQLMVDVVRAHYATFHW